MILTASEQDVQKAVMDWLGCLPDCVVYRRNVGGMQYLKASGKTGIVLFGQPGMADLWGLVNKVHFEIEVKAPGKKPNAEQVAWLNRMRTRGAIAYWTDDLQNCIAQMQFEYERRGWKWLKEWECG